MKKLDQQPEISNDELHPVLPVVRHAYQRLRFTSNTRGKSLTKQQFKIESDINHIMARFEKTGLINHVNQYQGRYGDFTGVGDYHDVQNRIVEVNTMFMTLPSKIRTQFQNDPGLFLDFVQDQKNKEAVKALGLNPPPPAPVPAPPVSAGPAGEPPKAV